MRTWTEFIEFVRGTRVPPPPGPHRPLATLLLVGAALVHLPIVHALVRAGELAPPFTVAVGLVAMGLAWSGGVSLEGRRNGTALAIAAIALVESALAVVPPVAAALGPSRWIFLASGAFAAGALAALLRGRASR